MAIVLLHSPLRGQWKHTWIVSTKTLLLCVNIVVKPSPINLHTGDIEWENTIDYFTKCSYKSKCVWELEKWSHIDSGWTLFHSYTVVKKTFNKEYVIHVLIFYLFALLPLFFLWLYPGKAIPNVIYLWWLFYFVKNK
jgi:hypothetical protein